MSFSSCSKEDSIVEEKYQPVPVSQMVVSYEVNCTSIGNAHNILLDGLMNNNVAISHWENNSPSGVFNEIDDLIVYYYPEINTNDLEDSRVLVEDFLVGLNLFATELTVSDVKTIVDFIMEEKDISTEVISLVDILFDSYFIQDYDTYMQALNDLKSLHISIEGFEGQFVYVFIDVHEQSSLYWANYALNNNTREVSGFWRQQGTIIADAAGGAAGFAIAGPFGGYGVGVWTSFCVGNLLWNV